MRRYNPASPKRRLIAREDFTKLKAYRYTHGCQFFIGDWLQGNDSPKGFSWHQNLRDNKLLGFIPLWPASKKPFEHYALFPPDQHPQ
jgi:hypothetical protein